VDEIIAQNYGRTLLVLLAVLHTTFYAVGVNAGPHRLGLACALIALGAGYSCWRSVVTGHRFWVHVHTFIGLLTGLASFLLLIWAL
jgi:hypothetical protein